MTCSECRKNQARPSQRTCRECHNRYMRGYRKTTKTMTARAGYLEGFDDLKSELLDVFQRIGKGEMNGFTAAEVVKSSKPNVERGTFTRNNDSPDRQELKARGSTGHVNVKLSLADGASYG